MKINQNIFSKLPIDTVDIILKYYYGPMDLEVSKFKRELNNFIVNSNDKIILNISYSDSDYEKTPELYQFNNDIWFDYSIGTRLPKLICIED